MDDDDAAGPHDLQQPGPGRASAVTAIGAVTLLAIVTAGGIVGWARFGARADEAPAPEPALREELPASLPDGTPFAAVPETVTAAVEGPVVAVVPLEEPPEGMEGCADQVGVGWDAAPVFSGGVLTPDGVQVWFDGRGDQFGFAGPAPPPPAPPPGAPPPPSPEPPPPSPEPPSPSPQTPSPSPEPPPEATVRVVCSGARNGDGWMLTNSMPMPLGQAGTDPPGETAVSGGDGLMHATSAVTVPDGARWMVHDRGGYRLAYPVEGLEPTVVSWRFREGRFRTGPDSTRVTFLDAEGDVVDETFLRF